MGWRVKLAAGLRFTVSPWVFACALFAPRVAPRWLVHHASPNVSPWRERLWLVEFEPTPLSHHDVGSTPLTAQLLTA